MATLRQKAGKLLVNAGKLTCACCCLCKAPWCCNAPPEVYATLSLAGGRRDWQHTFGSGATTYTVTLDFDFDSPDGIYALPDYSGASPCGLQYTNESPGIVVNDTSTWPGIPQISVGYRNAIPPNVYMSVQRFFVSGKANYRRTGYLPGEELNRPFYLDFGRRVVGQSRLGSAYPCERWSALGVVGISGAVSANQAPQFGFYNEYVGNSPYPDWSTPLELKVSFDV